MRRADRRYRRSAVVDRSAGRADRGRRRPGRSCAGRAAATGVRRGARVVVAAPYEGPLRDTTAGRVAVLEPRLPVPDDFVLCRYLAAGLAVLAGVDPGLRIDLARLADELDTEALRNSAGRELFTNPAKTLAERMSGRRVVLAGDCAATLALAGTGARSCCGSPIRWSPPAGWPTRWWRCGPGSAMRPTAFSTTNRSTGHCPNGRAWWR
ncbi:putative tobH [Mycobacterium xenopi 3993]|nr:putative tobH [Mycobacterium xenopi 3993]